MIYLDLIISTPDPKIEITPKEDNKHTALRFEMSKPTMSWFQMWRLKKHIDESRLMLQEYDTNKGEGTTEGDTEGDEVQSNPED